MMALVEDEDAPHGPLQLLMTVAEEVGLEGANGLDGSLLDGKVLVNLDSEEDGTLTVGCAGSTDTWVRVTEPRAPLDDGFVALTVKAEGGLGGHSGVQIHLGRANAVKYLGRALREANSAGPAAPASRSNGGKSRNAIPRDARRRSCAVAASDEAAPARGARARRRRPIRDEYAKTDPDVHLSIERTDQSADAWTADATTKLLDVVALIPTGPLAMSPDFDGLVETSTSLGEAITDGQTADAAQPDTVVERLFDAWWCSQRWRLRRVLPAGTLRGQAQLRRVATESRLARTCHAEGGLRTVV